MTARTFAEAFGLVADKFPDDALSVSYAVVDLRLGCSVGRYREALDTLAKRVPTIIAQRDSARGIVAELEGQLAAVEALCDKAENPDRGWREVMFDGTPFPAFVSVDDIRAALTGGGDDARP